MPDGNPHPEAGQRPTILYFYGNAMCLNDAMFEFDHFRRLGLNVMIPEFVGYGMSAGKPSETGCRDTADAAFAHLQGRKDINPKKIVAAGWSLGGAVAVDLAARKPVAGLIAFSTFTSMAEMSRRSFPFLPATLLLRHRFDSEAKMSHLTCPILLGHGRRDEIVPVDDARPPRRRRHQGPGHEVHRRRRRPQRLLRRRQGPDLPGHGPLPRAVHPRALSLSARHSLPSRGERPGPAFWATRTSAVKIVGSNEPRRGDPTHGTTAAAGRGQLDDADG